MFFYEETRVMIIDLSGPGWAMYNAKPTMVDRPSPFLLMLTNRLRRKYNQVIILQTDPARNGHDHDFALQWFLYSRLCEHIGGLPSTMPKSQNHLD